ncbi:MAG: prepilin-type N-terminal cleavage/methylation domain-containing protein [Candidatus Pacebacteria bacterium]|nr:prepilin-type N-terminal cleavage/methylation domain-containing protein [Candidatus Paceibacterota bacterium]
MNTKSFTLIEIMIVVLTISILSSIIYVASGGIRERGEFAKVLMFSEKISSSLAENAVGDWSLDEATGSNVYDSSGNENNGTLSGTYSWETEKGTCVSGNCLTFNLGRVYINNLTSLSDSMTFSGWFKKTTSTWASIAFLGKRNSTTGWMLYRNSGDTTGYFRWYSHYVTTLDAVSAYHAWPGIYNLSVGKWYHILVTRNETGSTKIYLDSKLISNYDPPADFSHWSTNNYGVSIGSERAGSTSWSSTEAQMDEMRIYDRFLSNAQIKEQYYTDINRLLVNGSVQEKDYINRVKLVKNE